MEESISIFPKQFSFDPQITNQEKLGISTRAIVGGMGGSHLAAEIISAIRPDIDISIHSGYGIPQGYARMSESTLFVASSYSGNTEETLDFAEKVFKAEKPLAIMGAGGALIEFAKTHMIPHIAFKNTGIQPRVALGYSTLALATLLGYDVLVADLHKLEYTLKPLELKSPGEELATKLQAKLPIIYTSQSLRGLSYIWKIKFNETAKIPAFANVFPELNHNEMTGFDVLDSTKALSAHAYFIFIRDTDEHPQIKKRMDITKKLYEDRGLLVTEVILSGSTVSEKVFNSILLADWTALTLSKIYGTEPEKVTMIEDLKKVLA